MILQTVYKTEALEIIKGFVGEVSKYYGANEKEQFELLLASEEAATHIIDNFPSEMDDVFEVSCLLDDDTITITFNNKGLPVDKENIPQYDMDNPTDSIDGLKFFLIEKLVDKFVFFNRGNLGWQSILQKKILHPIARKTTPKEVDFITTETLAISVATPDDAYGITKLAYRTYLYTYAKTIFYYQELLSKAMADGNIISYVAKNTKDEIIAHLGLIRSAVDPGIVESGMMMVMPEYRKTTAVLRILKKHYAMLTDKQYGVKLFFSNLVTSHVLSQRMIVFFGLKPFALKLSVHEQAEMLNIDTGEQQRESHLYALAILDETERNLTLYVPSEHTEIIDTLFKEMPVISLTIDHQTNDYSTATTLFNTERFQKEQLGVVKIREFGNTLYDDLKSTLKKLLAEEYKTIHLYVPTNEPLPQNLEKELHQLGFFFSGIVSETLESWYLLYTFLEYQLFDFDKVSLYSDEAKALKQYVQNEYNKLN